MVTSNFMNNKESKKVKNILQEVKLKLQLENLKVRKSTSTLGYCFEFVFHFQLKIWTLHFVVESVLFI